MDHRYAFILAQQDGPAKDLEDVIMNHWEYSFLYARDILKGPFPAGEGAIVCGVSIGLDYHFRFNRDICSSKYLSTYPAYALAYAVSIRDRFPEGEPAMRKSPRIWRRYKEFIDVCPRSV